MAYRKKYYQRSREYAKNAPHSDDLTTSNQVKGLTEAQLDEICEMVHTKDISCVNAPTGAGKSTAVPARLSKYYHRIFITVPYRVSVYALSKRIRQLVDNDTTIGTAADSEIKYDNTTNIVFCTAGHLMNKMLNIVDCMFCDLLILDEAHMRRADMTVIMCLLRDMIKNKKTVPKILMLSATLDVKLTPFPSAKTYHVKTEQFPIDITYEGVDFDVNRNDVYQRAATRLVNYNKAITLKPQTSVFICFVPGASECMFVQKELEKLVEEGVDEGPSWEFLQVYSQNTEINHEMIFAPASPNMRKLIICTNVCESSITIPDGYLAVDTMRERNLVMSNSGGVTLALEFISQSSATQRAGRVGRTGPGIVHRMCSEHFYNTELPAHQEPELRRIPLHSYVMWLLNAGHDPVPLLAEQVEPKNVTSSVKLLQELKMIDQTNKTTEIGQFACHFQLNVRNAALLWHCLKNMSKNRWMLIVAIICAIDCYGPQSYFFYPSTLKTDWEYEHYYEKHFADFTDGLNNDIEVLQKIVQSYYKTFENFDPHPADLHRWCKENTFNAKKFDELLKLIKNVLRSLESLQVYVEVPFPDIGYIDFEHFGEMLKRVYKDKVYHWDGKCYVDRSVPSYSVEHRYIPNKNKSLLRYHTEESTCVALSTFSFRTKAGRVMNILSLFMPLEEKKSSIYENPEVMKSFVDLTIQLFAGLTDLNDDPTTAEHVPSRLTLADFIAAAK